MKSDGRVIFVRDYIQTHTARCEGKTASATSSRRAAAEAVARKIMGDKPFKLEQMGSDRAFLLTEEE